MKPSISFAIPLGIANGKIIILDNPQFGKKILLSHLKHEFNKILTTKGYILANEIEISLSPEDNVLMIQCFVE